MNQNLKLEQQQNSEGSDLITKEAKYHHGCKVEYLNGVKVNKNNTNLTKTEVKAFKTIEKYLIKEVLNKNDLSAVFDIYKRTFIIEGDIKAYTMQHFGEKIQTLSD